MTRATLKQKHLSLKLPARTLLILPLLAFLLASLTACKVAEDANAAAHQTTVTAADLSRYYGSLGVTLRNTIALEELQSALLGVPFDAQARAQQTDAIAEITRRRNMARALARLAEALSDLTGSTVSDDVSAAASDLGNELIGAKALPTGSPVPEALGKAGAFLLQWVQQHKEKEAAHAMDDTLASLTALFANEQPAYDSIYRTYLALAGSLAAQLANTDALDPTSLLEPALKPLGLRPLPVEPSLRATLKPLALLRIKAASDEAAHRQQAASDAMLVSLKEMNTRIHLLATGRPMPARGIPFSLKTVEIWVDTF